MAYTDQEIKWLYQTELTRHSRKGGYYGARTTSGKKRTMAQQESRMDSTPSGEYISDYSHEVYDFDIEEYLRKEDE